jgi:hypothetical protein
MNKVNTQAPQPPAAAAAAQSGEISRTLYNLTAIVRLAAFAAEARRTLVGIEDALHLRGQRQDVIRDSVLKSAQWAFLEDSTGEVLDYVACQLEKITDDFTENCQDLAPARIAIREAEKRGGRT